MPPKSNFIRCVGCRFRAATMDKDGGWGGLEYCLNPDSPLWGKPIILDAQGYFINPPGCEYGKPQPWDNPDRQSATMNCIPPEWRIRKKKGE